MGNTSSNYQDLVKSYKPTEWSKVQDKGNYQVWENLIQKLKFDVYPMPTELHNDIQELEKYQFRKIHHLRLVAPSFILKSDKSYLCSEPYSSLVAMEHIKFRLSQIPRKLNLIESLSVLFHSTQGFNIVTSFFGQIEPNDDLICFNEAGACKVWINQNLSNNNPSINNKIVQINNKNVKSQSNSMNAHLLNSSKNIQNLIQTIQNHTSITYGIDLKRELTSCQGNSDIISCIQNYCLTNKIQILDRINFDNFQEKNQIKTLPINYTSNRVNLNQAQIKNSIQQNVSPLQFTNTNFAKTVKQVILPNVINTNSRHYVVNSSTAQVHNRNLSITQMNLNLIRSDHSRDILIAKPQAKYQSQHGQNKIVIRYQPKIKQIVRMPIYNNYLTTQNSPITNRNPLTPSHSQKQITLNVNKIANINQNQDSRSSYNHPINNLQNSQRQNTEKSDQHNLEIQKRRIDRSETFINKLSNFQKTVLDRQIQKNQIKKSLKINQKESLQYVQMQFDKDNALNMNRQANQINSNQEKNLKQENQQILSENCSQKEENLNFRSQDLRFTQTKLSQSRDSQFVSQNDDYDQLNQAYQVQHIQSQQMMDGQMRVSENIDFRNYNQNTNEVQENNYLKQNQDLVKIQTEQIEKQQKNQNKSQNHDVQAVSSIQTQSKLKYQNLQIESKQKKQDHEFNLNDENMKEIQKKNLEPKPLQNMKVNLKQNQEDIIQKQNEDRYIQSQRLNCMDYDDIEEYVKRKYHDYLNKDKKQFVDSTSYKNYSTKYVPKAQSKPVQPYRSSFLENQELSIPKLQIKKIVSTTHNYTRIQNNLKNDYNTNFQKFSDKLILDTYEIDKNSLKFEEKKPIPGHKRNSSRTSYLQKAKEFDKIQEKYNKYVKKSVRESQKQVVPIYSSRDIKSYESKTNTNRILQNQENIESLSRISSKPVIQKSKPQAIDPSKQKKINYSTLRQLLWN